MIPVQVPMTIAVNGEELPMTASSNDVSVSVDVAGGFLVDGDYEHLANKPSINDVELSGNKTGAQLGLASSSDIPTKVSDLQNDSGFITGINSSDVTNALGFTPYNSTNPNGYVNASGAASAAPVQSVNGKAGAVALGASDVGAVPVPGSPSTGNVLMYNNGGWGAAWQEKSLQLPYQVIPISFDGTDFSTTLTPQDISEGYTVDGEDYPPYLRSSFTKGDLLGLTVLLTPIYGNTDGCEFQSGIFALDDFGWVGEIGLLRIETGGGYTNPYAITLVKWPANMPTPVEIGAIEAPANPSSGQVLAYSSGGTWVADDLYLLLQNESAIQIAITENNGVYHIDAGFSDIASAYLSCRKVLLIAVSGGNLYAIFSPVYIDGGNLTFSAACIGGMYNYQRLDFAVNPNGGMDGTLSLISTGEDRIPLPGSPSAGDFLRYVNNSWSASGASKSDVGLGNVDNVRQYSVDNPPPYPVTSVNGNTGEVSLSIPSTASDVGAVAVSQGVGHAGDFLVVGSDGNVTTVTMAAWQGGSY